VSCCAALLVGPGPAANLLQVVRNVEVLLEGARLEPVKAGVASALQLHEPAIHSLRVDGRGRVLNLAAVWRGAAAHQARTCSISRCLSASSGCCFRAASMLSAVSHTSEAQKSRAVSFCGLGSALATAGTADPQAGAGRARTVAEDVAIVDDHAGGVEGQGHRGILAVLHRSSGRQVTGALNNGRRYRGGQPTSAPAPCRAVLVYST